MPLTSLKFKPGINRESTSYSNEGGWFNGNKVRFRFGAPEKMIGVDKFDNPIYKAAEKGVLGLGGDTIESGDLGKILMDKIMYVFLLFHQI